MKDQNADYGNENLYSKVFFHFPLCMEGRFFKLPPNKIAQIKMKTRINQNMKSIKAQMKIQQMSFMLIAVFIFFALVGIFILTIKSSGLKDSATRLQEENALLLVSKLANSPEFSCELAFGSEKTDCIDVDKVMMLKENIEKYSDFWGISNIEIRRIYPKNRNIICTTLNYPNCDTIKILNKGITGNDRYNFVVWCRKEKIGNEIENKCELAKIIVRYEEVK